MIPEERFDAAITEEELDALLTMDIKETMEDLFPLDLDDTQLHSWDDTLSKMDMEDNPCEEKKSSNEMIKPNERYSPRNQEEEEPRRRRTKKLGRREDLQNAGMIAEERFDAAITEEELDAILTMDTKEMMEDLFPLDLDDNQLHSWDDTLSKMDMEDNPEKMKEELDALFMMDTNREETEATKHSQPQLQHSTNMEEQCAIDVHVNQPPQPCSQPLPLPQPQLESPPQPCSQSLPRPLPQLESQLQSQHQSKSQTDINKMTDQFFNDTWGYQPPSQMIAAVGGHQPLQSQPQPQVWTWEENKAFELVMANCLQDAIHNHWKTVAAQLPGKTPAQLQERFLKVMTDVNAIKHGYPGNMSITIPVPATPLEHSPLSIPIVNATPPPPPPHWTHHHHRMEAMALAADMAVPMDITLPSSTMSGARREQNRHTNSTIIQPETLPVASSDNNKRRQTVHWTLQEHKYVVSQRLRRIRKTMVKNFK
ncbi:uncharacterized protein DS421_14g482830 [Arachis hypogaea]|nr:uncharacterized protein DS421_14g482830 [Arachis hypogaea]